MRDEDLTCTPKINRPMIKANGFEKILIATPPNNPSTLPALTCFSACGLKLPPDTTGVCELRAGKFLNVSVRGVGEASVRYWYRSWGRRSMGAKTTDVAPRPAKKEGRRRKDAIVICE